MSAFGGNLNFGVTLNARDNTSGAFRSALSNVQGLARAAIKPITIPLKMLGGGLGFLRDLQQGLRPTLAAMDGLVTRGTALGLQQKALQGLTGQSAAGAQSLARKLVEASAGTLKLAEAFQIANRGLGSGLNLEQLGTAIDFISKKSVATGKNASEAISTVITGLSRGSTLFLDDFGILVDGIEGVKRSFDSIKGAGAFDSLGPAAQKAEIIRAAIAEMQAQTSKLNISTKDMFFQWQSTKTAISDAGDALAKSFVGLEAIGNAVKQIGAGARSISEFLGSGGGFLEAVMGSVDILTAFALDFGDIIGGSIATAIAKKIKEVAPKIAAALGITDDTIKMIEPSKGFFRTAKEAKALKEKAEQQRAINGQGEGAGEVGPGAPRAPNQIGSLSKKQTADLDRERRIITGDTNFEIRRGAAKRADDEIRARRAKGERVPYSERDRLVAQYRDEETTRRLAANDAKRSGGGAQGGAGGIHGFPPRDPYIHATDPVPPPPELQPRELGPSRPNANDAAARVTKEAGQKTQKRKGGPALTDAEKAERRKRQARKSIETLPEQIRKNIARLNSNFREGFMGGYMNKEQQDALIRQITHDVETLDRDAGRSGTERSGYGLENYRTKDGKMLSEHLDKFEDYLQRERSEVEPFGPSHPMRQRSQPRDRVRSIRSRSRARASKTFGESYRDERADFDRLSDEQGRLTREGVRDMDREGFRGNLTRGIKMIEQGTAMEPLIRESMKKLEAMDRRASELLGINREVINSIHGLIGTIGGENQKLAALARG